MRVFHDLKDLPAFKNAVVTIGSFDGVHQGHQQLLSRIKNLAKEHQGESIVITFHPHPRLVIYPKDKSLELINSIHEKVALFEKYGIDNLVIVPFSVEFSQQSPDEYIEKFLVEKFNPSCIVIGYDHRFGLNRKGDIHFLKHHAKTFGFDIEEITAQEVDNIAISSTKVRAALKSGDIAKANGLLGHAFSLDGVVVHGQRIGHKLGYPTANIEVNNPHKLIPSFGIYAVRVMHKEEWYEGMLYIGNRPTLKGIDNVTIEVNIFDFNKDIYGDKLTIEFVDYVRSDKSFKSLDELSAQLGEDKIAVEAVFEKKKVEPLTVANSNDEPEVAVVILNYNTADLLAKFIPILQQTTYSNYKIVVADNGSSDDSCAVLKAQFPEVVLIELGQNYGFAEGYNQALQYVDSEYLVLLNSDVEVTPDWLNPIIETMKADATIAAAQPKIRAYNNKSSFEHAGAAGGFMDALGYPFCRGRILDKVEADKGQYDENRFIFWATGCAMVVRNLTFKQMGGFDKDYFAHMEEIDLCWRMKRAGYRIAVVPASVVYHIGGGTLDYMSPRKTYLNFRNNYYTLYKNKTRKTLIWLIPFRLCIDALAGVLFLFEGKVSHIKAIVQAHWAFFGKIGELRQKRAHYNELIKKHSISNQMDTSGLYSKSIVWEFYIRRRKVFSKLKK